MPNPFEVPLMQLARTIIALKPVIIDKIGVEALAFVADNFRLQGYQGRTFIPWAIQKRPDYPRPHKILVLDKHLIGSFTKTDNSEGTTISTDSPYARVHNEGYQGYQRSRMGTFGKPIFQNIPQRQFLPITPDDHPLLLEKCQAVIIRKITEALPS